MARKESWKETSRLGRREKDGAGGQHDAVYRIQLPLDIERRDDNRDHQDAPQRGRRGTREEQVEYHHREGGQKEFSAQVQSQRHALGAAGQEEKPLKDAEEDDPDVKTGDGEYMVHPASRVGVVQLLRHVPGIADQERLQHPPFGTGSTLQDETPKGRRQQVHTMTPAPTGAHQHQVVGPLDERGGEDPPVRQLARVVALPRKAETPGPVDS